MNCGATDRAKPSHKVPGQRGAKHYNRSQHVRAQPAERAICEGAKEDDMGQAWSRNIRALSCGGIVPESLIAVTHKKRENGAMKHRRER